MHAVGSGGRDRRQGTGGPRLGLDGRPEDPGASRVRFVRLEHSGWEVFGDQAEAARAEYDHGWPVVLDAYAARAASAAAG